MRFVGIILLAIGAAVVYGVLHDQITARVCVEYFTIGHPRIIESDDPTVVGLVWGVVATWWMGLLLGLLLACACTIGPRPRLGPRDVLRPIAVLLIVMAAASAVAGLIGYLLAVNGLVFLIGPLKEEVPQERHAAFLADGFAHGVSYATGALGALVVCALALRRRARMRHHAV